MESVKKKVILKSIYSGTFITLIMFFILFQSNCIGDSEYNRFSQGFGFTFEYPNRSGPEKWLIDPTFKYTDHISTGLLAPNIVDPEHESPVKVKILIWLDQESTAEEKAQDIISRQIIRTEGSSNFTIIRRETVNLDEQTGYLVEYSFMFDSSPFEPPGKGMLIPTREMNIAIPRDQNVYDIWISASQNEWNRHEKFIEHILDTFRWK